MKLSKRQRMVCLCLALVLTACGCGRQGPSGRSATVEAASLPPPPALRLPTLPHNPPPITVGALAPLWKSAQSISKETMPHAGGFACADLDGDGKPEVLVRSSDRIVVLNGSGKRLRAFSVGEGIRLLAVGRTPKGPLLLGFDIWADGVEACDKDGKRLWRFPVPEAVDWVCPVDVHAPEGDAVAIGGNGDGGLRLVGAEGTLRWQTREPGNVWSVASAHLRKGDPASILCAQTSIWVYNSRGQKTQEIGRDSDAGVVYGADVDGDGIDEVFGFGNTAVSGSYLSVYGAEGTLRWRQQIQTAYEALASPIVVGRFEPSGRQVALGISDGTLLLFQADGKPLSYLKVGPDLRAMALLERGAGAADALVVATSEGVTCYAWKAGKPSPIPTRLLVPPPAPPEPPLIQAVQKNDLPTVNSLLERGRDPNTRNTQGSQALVLAARQGALSIVQTLVEHGAKVDAQSRPASTPLLMAIENGHLEVVRYLLDHGVDVNQTPATGYGSPLISAAMEANTDIGQLLIARGADVNRQAADGKTALFWAADKGSLPFCEMLLAHGAQVDARDMLGMTPLMGAVMEEQVATIRLLIARGANVNARTDQARTLYGKAGFVGDKKAQKQIKASGRLNVRHEDGASALDYAWGSKKKEIVEMLRKAGARENTVTR